MVMNKQTKAQTRLRHAALALGAPLLLLIGGCEPLSADTLRAFLVDFARGGLAAWVL
jgi:hypothetical protein